MIRRPGVAVAVVGQDRHADAFAAAISMGSGLTLRRAATAGELGSIPARRGGAGRGGAGRSGAGRGGAGRGGVGRGGAGRGGAGIDSSAVGAAIIAGDPASRLSDVRTAVEAGWTVMVASPLGSTDSDIDALVEFAESSPRPVVFGEPICWSPIAELLTQILDERPGPKSAPVDPEAAQVAPGERRAGGPSARPPHGSIRLCRPDDGSDTLDSLRLRATALALTIAMPVWGDPDLARCGNNSVAFADPTAPVVAIEVGHGPAAITVQFASSDYAITGEIWPRPDVSLNGQQRPLDEPIGELDALGYVRLLRGLVAVAAGQGGVVAPLGFGRLAAHVERAVGSSVEP